MKHLLLAVIVAAFLLGLGVFHGLATDRWSGANEGDLSASEYATVPLDFGDWKGEMLPRQADADPKTAVDNRKYTHALSGRWVLTTLTSGRAGRVSIHNPEHCYLGSGYKVVDTIRAETFTINGQTARFWTGHFEKKKAASVESIRIYWGWTFDGLWQAPEYPRLFYAGKPRLHKLYLVHPAAPGTEPDDAASYKEFLVQYLGELNKHLGP